MAEECADCEVEMICFMQELGGVDYYDEYVLYCPSCERIERKTVYGGSPIQENWITKCPFCGKGGDEHDGVPKDVAADGEDKK